MFVMLAFHSSLLCMFAAHDVVWTRQVGGAEMKKNRKMSSLVSRSQAKRSIEKLQQLCASTRHSYGLGHDEEPSALTALLFQRTKSHRNELPGAENSRSENTSPTVDKALMLKSPPMKSTLYCFMYPWWMRHVSWQRFYECARNRM